MSPARFSIGQRERSYRSHRTWARKSTVRRTTVVDVAVLFTSNDTLQVTPPLIGRHVGKDLLCFVGSLTCGRHAVLQRSRRSSGGGNAIAESSAKFGGAAEGTASHKTRFLPSLSLVFSPFDFYFLLLNLRGEHKGGVPPHFDLVSCLSFPGAGISSFLF